MTNTIKVGDAELAYRLSGPSDAPLLTFAHGLAADMSMWDSNVDAFTDHYRVLRYDMRGHGGSSHGGDFVSLDRLADDAIGLLDALAIDRTHFVGLSLGGIIGQQLGARYGNRLRTLALCNTMSVQSAGATWDRQIERVQQGEMSAVAQTTLERWFTPAFLSRAPDRIEGVRRMILRTGPADYIGCALALRNLDQRELLGRISVPTLVLTGREDPAATPSIASTLHAAITASELAIIEGAAHMPNIEQPISFNATLLAFLSRHTGIAA